MKRHSIRAAVKHRNVCAQDGDERHSAKPASQGVVARKTNLPSPLPSGEKGRCSKFCRSMSLRLIGRVNWGRIWLYLRSPSLYKISTQRRPLWWMMANHSLLTQSLYLGAPRGPLSPWEETCMHTCIKMLLVLHPRSWPVTSTRLLLRRVWQW